MYPDKFPHQSLRIIMCRCCHSVAPLYLTNVALGTKVKLLAHVFYTLFCKNYLHFVISCYPRFKKLPFGNKAFKTGHFVK